MWNSLNSRRYPDSFLESECQIKEVKCRTEKCWKIEQNHTVVQEDQCAHNPDRYQTVEGKFPDIVTNLPYVFLRWYFHRGKSDLIIPLKAEVWWEKTLVWPSPNSKIKENLEFGNLVISQENNLWLKAVSQLQGPLIKSKNDKLQCFILQLFHSTTFLKC